jgi:histidinol-phosphatase
VPSLEDDLALALGLADAADAITVPRFRAVDLHVQTKPDMTPVSEADVAVEESLRARLANARPRDSVIGEEGGTGQPAIGEDGGRSEGSVPRRWIIDPIDGTKGYVRGMPVWATLLALQDESQLTVGVISAPALGRRWWAARGQGAYMSDGLSEQPRRIRVSGVDDLADAQLSFGDLEDWAAIGRRDALLELAGRCWRARGLGDFWSYMLVAEGVVEIAVDPTVAIWDLAASQMIVEEAGGRQTDLEGISRPDGGSGLATNGLLHQAALEILGGPGEAAA